MESQREVQAPASTEMSCDKSLPDKCPIKDISTWGSAVVGLGCVKWHYGIYWSKLYWMRSHSYAKLMAKVFYYLKSSTNDNVMLAPTQVGNVDIIHIKLSPKAFSKIYNISNCSN